jgi:hypothetical protein
MKTRELVKAIAVRPGRLGGSSWSSPKTGQSTVMARMKVAEKNWWTIRESLLGSYA